jgi:hypothetical protein
VGPRAGLDAGAIRKTLYFCRGSNPGRPVRSQSLYRLSYPRSVQNIVVSRTSIFCIFKQHTMNNIQAKYRNNARKNVREAPEPSPPSSEFYRYLHAELTG